MGEDLNLPEDGEDRVEGLGYPDTLTRRGLVEDEVSALEEKFGGIAAYEEEDEERRSNPLMLEEEDGKEFSFVLLSIEYTLFVYGDVSLFVRFSIVVVVSSEGLSSSWCSPIVFFVVSEEEEEVE